jgi:hypothetical protein
MFHMDVAKIERDVEYVAMVVHVCCKRLFSMFHLFLDVCCKNVYLCCIYFTHMLQIFYLRMMVMVSSVF